MMLLFLLPGCSNVQDSGKGNIDNNVVSVESTTLASSENRIEEAYTKTEDASIKNLDYKPYLRKSWLVEDQARKARFLINFCIIKIEDGKLEGIVESQRIAHPLIYESPEMFSKLEHLRSYDSRLKLNLFGTVSGNVATCYYEDKGTAANIKLVFKENDTIEATIKYTAKNKWDEELRDGWFVYIPYNVSDVRCFTEDKKVRVETHLNSWGDVYIVSGPRNFITPPGSLYGSDRTVPHVYLTNKQGDILYDFGVGYHTESRVHKVQVEDLNGDGLMDVRVITCTRADDIDDPNILFKWTFYQAEDGLFIYDGCIMIVREGDVVTETKLKRIGG